MYYKGNYIYPQVLQYVLDNSFLAMKEEGTEGASMDLGTVKDRDTGRVYKLRIELSPIGSKCYELSKLESFIYMVEPLDDD